MVPFEALLQGLLEAQAGRVVLAPAPVVSLAELVPAAQTVARVVLAQFR